MSAAIGKIERIFDIYPYPRSTKINIVICDVKGATLATADPERSKIHYYKDAQVPVIWYLTSATVAGQGDLMRKVIIDHIYKDAGLSTIKVIWIPCSGIAGLMKLPRDIYEVVDSIVKCKEVAKKYNVKVEISLATSWLPLGHAYHDEALRVVSMNRALQVVGYW